MSIIKKIFEFMDTVILCINPELDLTYDSYGIDYNPKWLKKINPCNVN